MNNQTEPTATETAIKITETAIKFGGFVAFALIVAVVGWNNFWNPVQPTEEEPVVVIEPTATTPAVPTVEPIMQEMTYEIVFTGCSYTDGGDDFLYVCPKDQEVQNHNNVKYTLGGATCFVYDGGLDFVTFACPKDQRELF